MKLAIDPGHGMANTRPGQFDPGATDAGFREADIALAWALTLKAECVAAGIATWLSRPDNAAPDPVGTRDDRAKAAGCTRFLAIHLNEGGGTGTEVYYRSQEDRDWAQIVLTAALGALGLPNRGLKAEGESQHDRLAVFDFPGPCCLVELGFIDSKVDRARLLSREVRIAFAEKIVKELKVILSQA